MAPTVVMNQFFDNGPSVGVGRSGPLIITNLLPNLRLCPFYNRASSTILYASGLAPDTDYEWRVSLVSQPANDPLSPVSHYFGQGRKRSTPSGKICFTFSNHQLPTITIAQPGVNYALWRDSAAVPQEPVSNWARYAHETIPLPNTGFLYPPWPMECA